MKTPEDRFRHAYDLPPMTLPELSAQTASPRFSACGYVALALALAMLFVWIEIASGQSKYQRVIGKPDVAAMVRPESKRCKYRIQGPTLAPVLVCGKGRAAS